MAPRDESWTWESPAAHSLMNAWRTSDPKAAIRASAGVILDDAEIIGAPVDLDRVGSYLGVLVVHRVPMRESGRLTPVGGEYKIELNRAETRGRQRFTHAHEISHILIPTYAETPSLRTDMRTGQYARNDEEEHLCDVGATELLMPDRLFYGRARSETPGIEGILSLADAFQVSLEAAALRAIDAGAWTCALVVWEEMLKPSEVRQVVQSEQQMSGRRPRLPVPKLRIRYARVSPDLGSHFFPSGKSCCDGSLVSQCMDSDTPLAGITDLPTSAGPMTFPVECLSAPYPRNGKLRKRAITIVLPRHE